MHTKLHATRSGEGPAVVLLHGMFGSGGNLGALARSLQDRYSVYSVDLPNHGRSAWLERGDIPAMAQSLQQWMLHHELSVAHLVGHSLGGKVAMQLALSRPELVGALVVADIAPVTYPARHDAVLDALQAVAALDCTSRQDARECLARYLEEPGVVEFLLGSLRRAEDGIYRWRFNLQGILQDYGSLREAPLARGPHRGPVQFIKGADSAYIQERHRGDILRLFPQAQLKVMPGCGHWLHAEQPRLFNSLVGRFLDAQPG
jgi:esterase